MKFFITVVMILVILASGYAISARRYAVIGCGITKKWSNRANVRVEALLLAFAILPITVLVCGLVAQFYAFFNCTAIESRIAAVVVVILAVLGYDKLLSEMMETGEHNGRLRAERAAKRNKRHCQIECEYAGWGETILKCQNPTCLNCPLMEQYDIKPRIYRHDILESVYRHERIERAMRRRGKVVPTSYVINIPIERVLNKVFDVEGWYDTFAEPFATPQKREPIRAEACNIIPFPIQPQVEPEPVVLEGEIVEDQPEPVRRKAKYSKVVVNRGDRGLRVEDHGTYLSIFLAWADENGERQYGEYTLDKTSPDCLYFVNDVAAIDLNAALKLQAMAIPAETL